jgi:hypothetical protein
LSDIVKRGQFQPGESGNPTGRPQGARNVLSRSLLADLTAEWEAGGREALRVLRVERPDKFVLAALSILPRDVLLRIEDAEPSPFAHLSPEQKRELAAMLTARVIEARPVEGDVIRRQETGGSEND